MSPEEVKRKLAAILSVDVEGYSRLIGEDEVGTIRTLLAVRQDEWPIQTQRRIHDC